MEGQRVPIYVEKLQFAFYEVSDMVTLWFEAACQQYAQN
jgi:hypothetical protein